MQDKKGRILILGGFYIILSLEVGRRPAALPVSNGLRARRNICATHAYTNANSQVPKVHGEEISPLI
jgi:hypothetical protein